jgi:ribosomal protein S18 acetylase RimI-like enzyme
MLNKVVEEAKDNDLAQIRLTVNRGNTSVKVYQSFGFEIEEEVDFDIGNGYFMNDFVMVKTF